LKNRGNKESVEINYYSETDVDEALKLLTVSFGPPFSRERWEWLHLKNIKAPSFILVARFNGIMVGIYAAIKKELIINGESFIAARDIDPVVNPIYRGRGIFSKLLEVSTTNNEIKININFSKELAKPGYISKGWKEVGIKHLFAPGLPVLSSLYRLLYLNLFSFNINCDSVKIVPISSIDEFCINEDMINYERLIYIRKTRPYLNWRYKSNPDRHYRLFKALVGDSDVALIICSGDRDRISILEIINQGSLKKKQILKSFLRYYFSAKQAKTLVTWNTLCDGVEQLMVFGKLGYFLVKNRSPYPDRIIYNGGNWEFGPGESEFL
jgi:hypothetical protein